MNPQSFGEADDMTQRALAVLILNWNGGDELSDCVASVKSSHGVEPHVVVVDNGSTDNSSARVVSQWADVTVLHQRENIGVARGFNLGMAWAREQGFKCLCLVNSDATLDPDCLHLLVEAMAVENAAMVTPRILDTTREASIWFDGGYFNVFGYPTHRHFGNGAGRAGNPVEEDFVTGCVALIEISAFDAAGSFFEDFFAYAEDVDFSLRVRNAGRRILHVPRAVAWHAPSSSVKKNAGVWMRDYYILRNNLLLFDRRQGKRRFLFLSYVFFQVFLMPALYFLLAGQRRRAAALLAGMRDYLRGRFGRKYG